MGDTLALRALLALSEIAAPLGRFLLKRRLRRGKEPPDRLDERMGAPSAPRPDGALIWLHAASVGEAHVACALSTRLRTAHPRLSVLLTTGTVTAASILDARSEPGEIAQFAPLDVRPWVRRFLGHWRPDAAARIDSELWPAALVETARSGAGQALVNARISARSARGWSRAPRTMRALLSRFDAVLAQDAESAERFASLGVPADRLSTPGSLKAGARPLDVDEAALAALRAEIGARPVWLAASTHAGEEALALDAAEQAACDGLLTIIAPRHPERGDEVAALASARGLRVAQRSAGRGARGADVYVADTLGEMGLWYRLAPFVFLGGSTQDLGGHNPYEPAALGAALAHGPDTANFAEPFAALAAEDAASRVEDAAALGAALAAALADPAATRAAGDRACRALAPDEGPLDAACDVLLRLLERR